MPRYPRNYLHTSFFHVMVQGEGFENLGKTKLNEILKVPYDLLEPTPNIEIEIVYLIYLIMYKLKEEHKIETMGTADCPKNRVRK